MSKKLYAGNRGTEATGNNRLQLFEPPGTVEPFQVVQGREPNGSADSRPKSEGTTAMGSEQMRRSAIPKKTLDLHSHCPVCSNAYKSAEAVLALTSLAFATSAVPSAPAAVDCDPSSKIVLGHQRCVLPRLLTLLAGFQPEVRFVNAAQEFSVGESVFPERHHDEP